MTDDAQADNHAHEIAGPDVHGFYECLQCGSLYRDREARVPYYEPSLVAGTLKQTGEMQAETFSEGVEWALRWKQRATKAEAEIDNLRQIILNHGDRNVIKALEAHDARKQA